jgi:hypothetical protein
MYYFFVALGIRERGDLTKYWLRFVSQSSDLPLGVTVSKGEKRVPPVKQDFWLACGNEAFNDSSNLTLHTDSAATYESCTPRGVVEWFTVNHQQKEFARSIEKIKNPSTGEKCAAMTGTMTIDRTWRSQKRYIPKGGVSCRTAQGRLRMMRYVRSGQWKIILGTSDRWPLFCAAARRYAETVPDVDVAIEAVGCPPSVDVDATDVFEEDEDPVKMFCAEAWGDRYFERQEGARCGLHCLNNLVGAPQFTTDDLRVACNSVLVDTGELEGDHRLGNGWYSHSVLARAMDLYMPPTFRMLTAPLLPSGWLSLQENQSVIGAAVNINNNHWAALAKHSNMVWFVDSEYAPVVIDSDDLAEILKRHPMTFLVVSQEYD